MNDNFDEKLLTGTAEETLLPPVAEENYPLQNAKEFLTRTPAHELKNIFGATPDLPPIPEKPILKPETPAPAIMPIETPRHPIVKFLGVLLLLLLLVATGLYIWGGLILEK